MLSNEVKKEIVHLHNTGMSYRKIGEKFSKTKKAIEKVIKRYNKPLKKRGRKRIIDKNDRRRIRSYIMTKNMAKEKVTCIDIKHHLNLKANRMTIFRELKTMNYNYGKLPHKWKLNVSQKLNRAEFCKYHFTCNTDWNKVCFTDEKRFSLVGCDSYYSWFYGNQKPENVRKVLRAPSLMIWGIITSNGLLSYKVLDGYQNSDKYIETLNTIALPMANLNIGSDFIYQQDNCPCHASKKTKNWLNNEQINFIKWPTYSPDLNLIENTWAMLSKHVYKNGSARNLSDLKSKIYDAVLYLNTEKRHETVNLFSSMRRRLCEVIWRRGDKIPY